MGMSSYLIYISIYGKENNYVHPTVLYSKTAYFAG